MEEVANSTVNGPDGSVRPKVAVVVLNWNGYEHTSRCLTSLGELRYPNLSVVVVDNGSTDDSARKLQEAFPQSEFVLKARNLGFAAGCNAGTRHALQGGADYVLLLNNDAVLAAGGLETAVRVMEKDHAVGLVGGKIYYQQRPGIFESAGGTVSLLWGREFARGKGHRDRGQYDSVCETGFVSGAMMLISRRVLADVGLLDESFFFSFEECDYCIRVRRSGYKLFYVPDLVAHHYTRGSHGGFDDPRVWYCVFRCRLIFQSRFHSRVFFWLWALVILAHYMTFAAIRHAKRGRRTLRGCRFALKAALRDHWRTPMSGVTQADLDRFNREFEIWSGRTVGHRSVSSVSP